jgi:hypothetical protein
VKKQFALIRGHHHPDDGDTPKPLRGVAADVDDELRRLTGGMGDETP